MILLPQNFKRSHSLTQTIKKGKFEVRFDEAFENVISHCAGTQRKGEDGTWITPDMISAYVELHNLGYAHSVESYLDGKLAGGLYGISLGKAFFGESMFHIERDASKIALASLVDRMLEWDFHFIDAQQRTEHLRSLGAQAVPRNEYLEMLEKALTFSTRTGKW
jgi:leucyl/phenylalanyl-tRNA--protein transferase